jgi:hypothetical protein
MAFMMWWSARIQFMNQNESPDAYGDVLAALPTRTIHESNERQPHRYINPLTHGWPPLVSHKT